MKLAFTSKNVSQCLQAIARSLPPVDPNDPVHQGVNHVLLRRLAEHGFNEHGVVHEGTTEAPQGHDGGSDATSGGESSLNSFAGGEEVNVGASAKASPAIDADKAKAAYAKAFGSGNSVESNNEPATSSDGPGDVDEEEDFPPMSDDADADPAVEEATTLAQSTTEATVEVTATAPDQSSIEPTMEVAATEPTTPPTMELATTEPTTTEPTVEVTTTEPTVEVATTEPTVEMATTEPTVEAATAEATVEAATTEPTVELATTEPTVEVAEGVPERAQQPTEEGVNTSVNSSSPPVRNTTGATEENVAGNLGNTQSTITTGQDSDDSETESVARVNNATTRSPTVCTPCTGSSRFMTVDGYKYLISGAKLSQKERENYGYHNFPCTYRGGSLVNYDYGFPQTASKKKKRALTLGKDEKKLYKEVNKIAEAKGMEPRALLAQLSKVATADKKKRKMAATDGGAATKRTKVVSDTSSSDDEE